MSLFEEAFTSNSNYKWKISFAMYQDYHSNNGQGAMFIGPSRILLTYCFSYFCLSPTQFTIYIAAKIIILKGTNELIYKTEIESQM